MRRRSAGRCATAPAVPIPGAVVTLLDSAAGVAARTTTDGGGQFRAVLVEAAYAPYGSFVLASGLAPSSRLRGRRDPGGRPDDIDPDIDAIRERDGRPRVPPRPDRALAAAVLEQARAGFSPRSSRGRTSRRAMRLRATQFVDMVSNGSCTSAFASTRQARRSDRSARLECHGLRAPRFPLRQRGVGALLRSRREVLLDDRFTSAYCFHLAAAEAARPNQIGLGFRPPNRRNGRIDVDGTIWIDTAARALVDIEYRYLGTDPRGDPFRPGGRIAFRTMPNGVVVIDRWSIRLVSGQGAEMSSVAPELATRSFYGIEGVGELARASWADGYTWLGPLGTVRLRVVGPDGRPLPGALVRLADTDYQATADLNGDLGITDLIPGRYVVTRVDPELAAIGIPVDTLLEFVAGRGRTLITRIKVPEIADYVGDRCGDDDIVARLTDERWATRASLHGRVTGTDGQPVSAARWSSGLAAFRRCGVS